MLPPTPTSPGSRLVIGPAPVGSRPGSTRDATLGCRTDLWRTISCWRRAKFSVATTARLRRTPRRKTYTTLTMLTRGLRIRPGKLSSWPTELRKVKRASLCDRMRTGFSGGTRDRSAAFCPSLRRGLGRATPVSCPSHNFRQVFTTLHGTSPYHVKLSRRGVRRLMPFTGTRRSHDSLARLDRLRYASSRWIVDGGLRSR